MKKILIPAVIAASALFYNCTGDDAETSGPSTESSDTLQPGDSVYTDTVAQDSVYFPIDSIPGDTIIVKPFPGEPQPPSDTVVGDTLWAD